MDSVQSLRESQVSILCCNRSLKAKLYSEFINESIGSVQIICHRELETIIENISIKNTEQLYIILFEDQSKYMQKLLLKFPNIHIFKYSDQFSALIQKLHSAKSCQQYIDQAYQLEVLNVVQQYSESESEVELFSLTAKAKEVFTETECMVITLMIEGFSIKEIAEKIYLSPYTVTGYVEAIKRKLKVSSKLQLINRMFKNGYVNRG